MAKSARQRQALYRENLRRSGLLPITANVTSDAVDLLRHLTREHGKTQGEMIALGLLLARQRLAKQAAPAATRQELPPVEPDAPASLRAPEARALALAGVAREVPHA